MKNFIKLTEAATAAERVYVPDRYLQSFTEAFAALTGIEIPPKPDRTFTAKSGDKTFYYTRGRDIPRMLERAATQFPEESTIGLSGSEWCADFALGEPQSRISWQNLSEKRMGRLALFAPPNVTPVILDQQINPIEVVTAVPNIVNNYRQAGRLVLSAVAPVSGGVEAWADSFGMLGVDLVSTGATLKQNDITLLQDLVDVFPVLISVGATSNE